MAEPDYDFERQLRRSEDPRTRNLGYGLLAWWRKLKANQAPVLDSLIEQEADPQMRDRLLALRRELDERSIE